MAETSPAGDDAAAAMAPVAADTGEDVISAPVVASAEPRSLAEVVLYAEFDVAKGSTLRASYPCSFTHYSPEFFADVMLPEGVHNREEDFTLFFLNRSNAHKAVGTANNDTEGTIDEKAADSDGDQRPSKDAEDPLKAFMYCLSVVRTTYDTEARRGAKVTAVALCSTHKSCFALKGVLDLAVRKIVGAQSDTESAAVLRELFDVVNTVDISGVRGLSEMERRLMKRTISSSGRAAINADDAEELERALLFKTHARWGKHEIPLRFKLCSTDDQHDDGTLRQLLRTFGEQTMLIYNAVLTGARVLLLGYNRPAGEVCSYVLSASSLVCPPLFGLVQRQFPYANLTDLGFLSVPGYIAGVTNPMFKTKLDWWDVLADVSTGEVFLSSPAEKEDFDGSDHSFVLEVMDGVAAGYDEEWVRCMFEEYTRKNVVDLALGEANYLSPDTQAKQLARNNKRITKWARTDNYKRFMDARRRWTAHSPAFDVATTGVDLQKHLRSLQGDMVALDDLLVEKIYADLAALLHSESELLELLSFLPVLRGGLHTVAQGILHPSMSVKHNTVLLLKRLEQFASTASSVRRLNAFLLMSYHRIQDLVQPESRT